MYIFHKNLKARVPPNPNIMVSVRIRPVTLISYIWAQSDHLRSKAHKWPSINLSTHEWAPDWQYIPITIRNSSCRKVMFSQACVKNSVHGGGGYRAP